MRARSLFPAHRGDHSLRRVDSLGNESATNRGRAHVERQNRRVERRGPCASERLSVRTTARARLQRRHGVDGRGAHASIRSRRLLALSRADLRQIVGSRAQVSMHCGQAQRDHVLLCRANGATTRREHWRATQAPTFVRNW